MSETPARVLFKALPGYPFYPCAACAAEGFKVTGTACMGDHTVLERAQAMHPGLVLHHAQLSKDPS